MSHKIHISKNGKTLVAIDNFDLQPGKITFLFGESGIGKSLLSKAIYGLIDPHLLDVTIDSMPYRDYLADENVIAAKRNGFFVFQEPSSHLNPLRTLETQINEGSLSGKSGEAEALGKLWEGKADAAVQQILRVFPKPYRPSGGEKQRILLAMAFKKIARFQQDGAPDNHLFVFDEP
ncbi:MAG: ATP-binding cassette domain-containing protein, partial [Calditrichaeota bacterium]|nr:ATP-binding cassette domain-containing protein [Calditrichota bacterium]